MSAANEKKGLAKQDRISGNKSDKFVFQSLIGGKDTNNICNPDGVQKSWFLIGMNEMGTPLLY